MARLECLPVENRWRISAQSSNLITFHDGWWPCFQLALLALFCVGVNTEIAGAELLVIDNTATLRDFQKEVRWNAAYYRLAQGI